MTQNVLTYFKFITIINIINYLLICTLIGIFYIVIDSNNAKLNILTEKIDILSLLTFTSIINILYIINIKITNLKYIIFISLSYIIIKYIVKKRLVN